MARVNNPDNPIWGPIGCGDMMRSAGLPNKRRNNAAIGCAMRTTGWLKPTPMVTWKCPAAGKRHASPTNAGMMPTIDQRPYPMVMATKIPSAIYGPKEEQRINDHPQQTGYVHSRGIGKQCPDHQKIRLQNKYYP